MTQRSPKSYNSGQARQTPSQAGQDTQTAPARSSAARPSNVSRPAQPQRNAAERRSSTGTPASRTRSASSTRNTSAERQTSGARRSSANAAGNGTRTASSQTRQKAASSSRSSSAHRTQTAASARGTASSKALRMNGKKPKRRNKGYGGLIAAIVIVALILIGAIVAIILATRSSNESPGAVVTDDTHIAKMSLPVPDVPRVVSTATIGATGDILIHDSVRYGAETEDGFDFSGSFDAVSSYWSSLDYMIANLEVTCGGEESGPYSGYPGFNAPDEIVTALKDAGVDMLLTANNHSYDTGEFGFLRTQEVVDAAGLEHIGTRESTNDSYVKVVDVNGIKFGMTCYTYDTREYTEWWKSLNTIPMSEDTINLVNSFSYEELDELYESCQDAIDEMEAQNADVKVFFLHFGEEYMDDPNQNQEEICQKLSDMGVDVIIGGHPHVIQKFDVLEGSGGNTTYCLYSMGNALSSQRKEVMVPEEPRGYTEDGLTIEITYDKFNNGKIRLKEIYILPTWVDARSDGVYAIVPLDYQKDSGSWDTANTWDAAESYDRTLGRLGEAYPAIRSELGNDPVPAEID